jgi:CRISPR-associated protein Csb1
MPKTFVSAVSGGVKTDSVNPRTQGESKGSAEGYGMVPHQRLEFTARSITAYVAVDHEQIQSYGLGHSLGRSCWRPSSRLNSPTSSAVVRCDCALRATWRSPTVPTTRSAGIPEPTDAAERVAAAITAAGDLLGPVAEVVWARATSGTRAKA